MERSGTTWLARMLADAFDQPAYSRERGFDPSRDAVIHGLDRDGAGVFRGHWTVRNYPYRVPVVMIARDPRAMALSSYYYHDKPDLDVHARWVVSKAPRGSSWSEYILEWLQYGAVWTQYEKLHQDTFDELFNIVRALPGKLLPTVAHLEQVAHDNNFQVMTERGTAHSLMRRGLIDEWRGMMAPETVEHIEQEHGAVMKLLGYL